MLLPSHSCCGVDQNTICGEEEAATASVEEVVGERRRRRIRKCYYQIE